MAVAQHRAPVVYAVPSPWAAALALALGMAAGLLIGVTTQPGQGLGRGLLLGVILGGPASVAVVFARRAVEQGARWWLVAAVGVGALVVVAALLFALTQLDPAMAPLGALVATVVGACSLGAGLRLVHRRRDAAVEPGHRRH